MRQFEWQQEFDGSQPLISSDEAEQALFVYTLLAEEGYMARGKRAVSERSFKIARYIADSQSMAIVVSQNPNTLELRSNVSIITGRRSDGRQASLYHTDGIHVTRTDIDTRPRPTIPYFVDPAASFDDVWQDQVRAIQDATENIRLEEQLGFANQPVGFNEVQSLAVFVFSQILCSREYM